MTNNSEPAKRPRGRPKKSRSSAPPPKPIGRPHLGDAAKRITVTVRVTPGEYELWRKQAEEAGVPLAAYLVAPLRRGARRKGKSCGGKTVFTIGDSFENGKRS
ncbi:MAG: hypothetical protein LBT97_13905 [Planctomycetota bacterium]|jgi:hypothetical protein|nr:hypothetical protein [Planctomycetota bacterium]